jgi:hypothetical protein
MESVEDFMDETVKASFGSLNSLAGIDPQTLEMIRKGKELMDLSMEYVKVSTEAFSGLEALEEKNQNLLLEIKGQLALLCEKK